jgi:hypothetical protein
MPDFCNIVDHVPGRGRGKITVLWQPTLKDSERWQAPRIAAKRFAESIRAFTPINPDQQAALEIALGYIHLAEEAAERAVAMEVQAITFALETEADCAAAESALAKGARP